MKPEDYKKQTLKQRKKAEQDERTVNLILLFILISVIYYIFTQF